MCMDTPSIRQDSSAPVTSVSPAGSAAIASRVPTGGVVIGQRDDVQPGRGGVPHQLGGRVRTVGGRGVAVQIDAHDADSRR